MYENLKFEIMRSGITQKEIAEFLGIHENSIGNKISGESSFSIEEAFKIREKFFSNFDLQYLFKKANKSA